MKTRKEFTFKRKVVFVNGKVLTKGQKYTICYRNKLINVEFASVQYRLNGGRQKVIIVAIDDAGDRYLLEYAMFSDTLCLIKEYATSKYRCPITMLNYDNHQPVEFLHNNMIIHTFQPFFDMDNVRSGGVSAKAFMKSSSPKLVEIDSKRLGAYRVSMCDNKIYADFDDLFVDYFATKEEATIQQPKPTKPITTDTQRRYINVIVSVDMNATKEEIMAEIEKSINTMIK